MGTENTETADITTKSNLLNQTQERRCNNYQQNNQSLNSSCQNNCTATTKSTTDNGKHLNLLKKNECNTITTDAASSSSSSRSNNDIKNLEIEIDENNIIDGAKEILNIIRPNWNLNNVKFKLFTDGITNKLVGCFNTTIISSSSSSPTSSSSNLNENNSGISTTNNDNQLNDNNDVVLVRIYGRKTDMLIDRKAETRNFRLLQKYNLSPSLFATFKNGLAYEYIPGITLTSQSIIQPKIWILIAKQMAEMHKVNIMDEKRIPMLWTKIQQFFDLIPNRFTDDKKQERITKLFPSNEKLRDDFKKLYDQLKILNSPIVFAHNDLLLGNVIYTESYNRVMFIDYEYAAYNYQGFDIGNHFTEFAGIDDIDYNRYPNKEFQFKWLRIYLETYLNTKNININDIEKLYIQVNQFALASHYFWTIWALIQAEHSTIDFDFIQFGYMRYSEYLAKKDQFLALQLKL